MFKTFLRSFISCKIISSKVNLENLHNQRVRVREQVRAFSKSKKSTKMRRSWELTNEAFECQKQMAKQKDKQQQNYRLVSYNILAQDLLVEHLYLYQGIDSQNLHWNHRLCCIQNELSYLDPDILCIQEMQFNHIKEFVGRLSDKRRLEYIFKKKTGHRSDGCAIIYDRAKFKLVAEQDVEFYQDSSHNLNRENIALLAKFKLCHEPDKEIIIATTHLLFNPRRHDVRVAQVEYLLKNLTKFARKCDKKAESNSYLPVILTGDMNSEPNSPPFNKLVEPCQMPQCDDENIERSSIKNICDTDNLSGEEEKEAESVTTMSVAKKRQLEPAPKFTLNAVDFGRNCASTYHGRWITVDYILRTDSVCCREVKIMSIYKLPTISSCERIGKIPNKYLGSDHYLQAVEFLIV